MSTYGYARVSTAEQVEGTSLASQERRVRAIAEYRGESMLCCFVDEGVSGSVPISDRPKGKLLMGMLCPGDVVIAAKLDRMFRSAQDALEWFNLFKQKGIKLILCDMGTDPVTENGVSKLMFSMLAAMAEFERDRLLERLSEGKRAKDESGGWNGGKPPFGYMIEGTGKTARCVPDPAHAQVLSYLLSCWAKGVSLRAAASAVSSNFGVRVSFNQVGRVYEKFDHDHADEIQRHNSGASA